jgi:hypothetical protein
VDRHPRVLSLCFVGAVSLDLVDDTMTADKFDDRCVMICADAAAAVLLTVGHSPDDSATYEATCMVIAKAMNDTVEAATELMAESAIAAMDAHNKRPN